MPFFRKNKTPDPAQKVRAFVDHLREIAAHTTLLGVIAVADRTGLFTKMAGQGPMTLDAVVSRSGLNRAHLRDALAALAAGGVLTYEPDSRSYELPPEHAMCLADDQSPFFAGGLSQLVPAILGAVPAVAKSFESGDGVPFEVYGDDLVRGFERTNTPALNAMLTQMWLPAMTDVVPRLVAGGLIADVGCGAGTAAILMAKTFPKSEVVGFDADARAIERAKAASAGVDNIRFEVQTAEALSVEPCDLITTFGVVHNLPDPATALTRIRESLKPSGSYLLMGPRTIEHGAPDMKTRGVSLYAVSTLYSVPMSLVQGGEGLGTAWSFQQLEKLSKEAGFSTFAELPIPHPINAFHQARP